MENITAIIKRFYKLYPVDEWKHAGFFNDEYVDVINYYWLQFDPPLKSSNYFLAVLYIIIMVFGGFGNLLVIYLYFRNKALKTSGNILIANLAISDLLMLSKTPIFIYNSFYEGPALGDIACRLYGFLGGLTGTASICTLAAIAFDRFYVIKYPLNRAFSSLRVKICLIVVWVYSFTFSTIPFLNIGLGQYAPEGYLTSCSFDYLTADKKAKIFILVFFCAAWVVPFLLITFSYSNILKVVLARSVTSKKERESFRHIREEDQRKQEVKLSLVVLCVIFLWFVAWTPYAVVALLGISGNKHLITPLSSMIPALFCKIASAIDPYVYALSHPKFRKEFFSLFKGKDNKSNSNRIWSVTKKPKQNFEEKNEEVSVVETVEVNTICQEKTEETSSRPTNANTDSTVVKRKRNLSITEMICFRPSFSNKSSNIRKIARRMSVKN